MDTEQKTILYVDDDPDDLAMFRQAVTAIGARYDIIEACDGVQGLELLRQMKQNNALPCLIVLDINMPRMDGKQTLIVIQKEPAFASIPIVLYSTSSSQMDKTFCRLRNVELVTKPFSFETIHNVTLKLLSFCKS
jgi:CheY-like chemotaxis protein